MKSLLESLFDDDILDNDDYIVNTWVKNHCSGVFKLKKLKKGTWKLTGNKIVIKNHDLQTFPEFLKISELSCDDFIITGCDVTSLIGLFEEGITVKCNMTISDCPKLESLEGCPETVDGTLCILNNQSLRNLEGAPKNVLGSCYISSNGKKFKNDYISKYINITKSIYCSVENDDEEIITEDFSHPYLSKFVGFLKANKIEKHGKQSPFERMFIGGMNIAWDKIPADHFDRVELNDNGIKSVRKAVQAENSLIFILNEEDDFTFVFYGKRYINCGVVKNYNGETYWRSPLTWYDMKITEMMNDIKRRSDCKYAVIIDFSGLSVGKLQFDRREARDGMVLPGDEDYNKKIAQENRERYARLLRELKAKKNTDVDQRLLKEYTSIIERFLKLNMDFIMHPDHYGSAYTGWKGKNKYTVSIISGNIKELTSTWDNFIMNRHEIITGHGAKYQQDAYETHIAKISKKISVIDTDLRSLGF